MSKRNEKNSKLVTDKNEAHSLEDSVQILKSAAPAKFDETVEMVINLRIDATQSDQLVRGSFSFPHGIGKSVRVIAIVEDSGIEAAKEAGALEAGGQDLIKRIEGGWLDFDVVVAHPSMMRHLGKLGRVLGPKGLMPSPKSGSVTEGIPAAVKAFSAGKIEFRNDRLGSVHVPVGKLSFEPKALCDNIRAFHDHIVASRPSAVKGIFVRSIFISSTMGPGVRVAF